MFLVQRDQDKELLDLRTKRDVPIAQEAGDSSSGDDFSVQSPSPTDDEAMATPTEMTIDAKDKKESATQESGSSVIHDRGPGNAAPDPSEINHEKAGDSAEQSHRVQESIALNPENPSVPIPTGEPREMNVGDLFQHSLR